MKKYILISILIILTIVLTSCNKDEETTATYKITFTGTWTEASHPTDYPSNAHFSALTGLSHKENTRLFEVGSLASEGIETMAETGNADILKDEIYDIIDMGNGFKKISGSGVGTGTGSTSVTVKVNIENSYITLVSMIAPSPDWFIAVQSVNLYENGKFVEEKTVEGIIYDSGTDSGTTFATPNQATSPVENIYIINDVPIGNGTTVENPYGTFVFEKM